MTLPARRVAVFSIVIGLAVLTVIVSLAVISSPGPPLLEREEPIRITLDERDNGRLSDTDPAQPPPAEAPSDRQLEPGPSLQFRPDPTLPQTDPAPRTRPSQQAQPVAPRPTQRPAPPASDYDDDADDSDDAEEDDDDDDD